MSAPRKILLVFPVGERGGAERVFTAIARHLDRRRFEPVAWFLRPGSLVQEIQALDVPTFLDPITRLSDPVNYWRTVKAGRQLIINESIQLVLSSLGYGHLYGGVAALCANVDAIWWQHGIASLTNWIDQLAVAIPAKLIITSSYIAARAHADALSLNGTPLTVIHPGIEPAPDRVWDRQLVLKEFGIEPGATVVATIGRLQPGKGQDVLIRAASLLIERYRQVMFLVVGSELFNKSQGYESMLKRLAAELGVADHIVFTGLRHDIDRLLSATDVFVHPATAPESFGLAVVEAMAAGKPVIVTDVGGPRETVVDGYTGMIIPPRDVQQLVHALAVLIERPSLREAMGQAARAHVLEHFSQQTMIRKVESALAAVLEC